ncbi:MAG TPA: hypothetical protein DDW68_02940 [Verrucomicrobiales bacterium]|nr:hypothetical protein [Verrucomicrobiales bacterium]HBE96114.1 hypothetical protein [Verrucomicrobiales bacterium]
MPQGRSENRASPQAFFHPTKARATPVLGVAENGPVKSCMNGGNLQWQCVDVLNLLQLRTPCDASIVLSSL